MMPGGSPVVAQRRATTREQWEHVASKTYTPLEIADSPVDGVFAASIRTVDMGGGTQISDIGHTRCTVMRTERGVRSLDDNSLYVSINLDTDFALTQDDRTAALRRGSASFYVSSMPYSLIFQKQARLLTLQTPRDSLPVAQRAQIEALARPVHASCSELGMLQSFLQGVLAAPQESVAQTADVLRQATIDLTALTVQAVLGDADPSRLERESLFEAMMAFIRTHATDADFTPVRVAETFHISRRLMFRIFESNGASPAAAIRTERLRRAAVLLNRPGVTVGEAALRTGFDDLATFGRAFKREHGMLPSQWRSRLTISQPAA